jgi:hypothetical protein
LPSFSLARAAELGGNSLFFLNEDRIHQKKERASETLCIFCLLSPLLCLW